MKKIIITAVACVAGAAAAMAQDRIITKGGDVVEAYRVDIGGSFVYYTKADSDDAQVQKMAKADVLMIRKQDNTVVNLYEDDAAQPREATASGRNEDAAPGIVQVKPKALTAEAKAANDELIARMNKPVNITLKKEKNRGKARASWYGVRAIFGVKENSVMANEDIEISAEKGYLDKKSKAATPVFVSNPNNGRYSYCNPAIKFSVRNKTDKTIYLDLGNSFYVRMGQSQCYYIPSSTTTSTSSSSGAGINLGAVANAAGIGGVAGTLANGINVGGGSTSGTTSTTYAQRVVAVPPMSTVGLTPQYTFANEEKEMTDGFYYALYDRSYSSYDFIPKINFSPGSMLTGDHYKYQENTSPLQLSFIVAYSYTEDCSHEKSITSYFYLKDLCGADEKEIDYDGELIYTVLPIQKKKLSLFPKK